MSTRQASLPAYPHHRSDCVMCREQDADCHFLVPEGWTDLPNGYRAKLCQNYIGK